MTGKITTDPTLTHNKIILKTDSTTNPGKEIIAITTIEIIETIIMIPITITTIHNRKISLRLNPCQSNKIRRSQFHKEMLIHIKALWPPSWLNLKDQINLKQII